MRKQDLTNLLKGKLLAAGVRAGETLVLAVSGGPDSMALLDSMAALQQDYNLYLVVVHVNHGLRPAASRDEKIVAQYCQKHELLLVVKRVSIRGRLGGSRIEERARELRYKALRQVASKTRSRFILTAHNQDDQVETIVLNFLRGSGLRGLGGMREVSDDILRPLLSVPKAVLLRYVKRYKIPFAVDVTNRNLQFMRNRVRHRLLPVLRQYNPAIDRLLLQNSYIFDQADIVIENLARHYLNLMRDPKTDKVSVSISRLAELSPFMQVEVIKAAIKEVLGGLKNLKKVHFDEIFKLMASEKSKSSKRLPGKLFVAKAYDKITISQTL